MHPRVGEFWKAGPGVFVVAAAVIGTLAAPALASFSAPVRLAGPGAQPAAAIDSNGNAIAVWASGARGLEERRVSASGALGPVTPIAAATPQPLHPQIAGDPGGDATIVWKQSDGESWRIRTRQISSTGQLGPVRTLSAPGRKARLPQVAADVHGSAVAVWAQKRNGWRVKARRISSTGALGRVKTLSGPAPGFQAPEIAMDADGDAIAVWTQVAEKSWRIEARRIPAEGPLGRVQALNAPNSFSAPGGPGRAEIASDAHGDAVAVWSQFDSKQPNRRIKVRRISAKGRLGRVKEVSGPQIQAQSPRIASNARGDTIVVWSGAPDAGTYRAQARQISPAGDLGRIQTLSSAGDNQSPNVSIDGSGNATAIWDEIHADQYHASLKARQILATGGLAPTQTLASGPPLWGQPQVEANAEGDAFAAWAQFGASEGSTTSIWAVRGP
jgi:hypothetical protein